MRNPQIFHKLQITFTLEHVIYKKVVMIYTQTKVNKEMAARLQAELSIDALGDYEGIGDKASPSTRAHPKKVG
uniref:Transposase n=1 Tax=Globodera pallida TaxID=36090 RepID=A0A183BMM9_GLOPA